MASQPQAGIEVRQPVARAVIDPRAELPPEARVRHEPPRAIHPPLGPPAGRAGEAPAPRGPAATAPAREGFPMPLGPSPSITEDFEALPDDMNVIPPDTFGAVGPDHLLVTLNSQVRMSDRGGAPLVPDRTLDGFWGVLGEGSGTFDPRAVYDPYADRWILVSCDDARSAGSELLLAVSDGGDPTLPWTGFSFSMPGGRWADYPNVGFNAKWVVVQFNLFTFAGSFVSSEIYVFDRVQLYADVISARGFSDSTGFTQVPALTYDMTQNDLFLLEAYIPSLPQLRLRKISGSLGSEAITTVGFPLAGSWNFQPPTADHAPQLGATEKIATNDARIQNLVFRNNTLWASHTVFFTTPNDRASVQWWQINPANAGVLQNGFIDDSTGTNFYAFPSLAVNKFGDAFLGFSCFAATRFASACYAFRRSTDAPGTFQDVATLKPGEAKYYKIYSGTENRWGDYSATQVDPFNDVGFWTIQEYAMTQSTVSPFDDRWGTWWGHLELAPDITIDDVSLAEGDSGTTNARFTISLSFRSTQLVEVDWVAADGSATLVDSDFQPASGRASFPPGTTTQVVNVPVVGDLKFEPNETFTVDLSSPSLGVIADAQAQGTILNDDPIPRMSIDDVRVVEGDTGPASATFTVTLSNPSASPAQATWSTANGTAVEPGDYTAVASGTVSFAAGDVSEPVIVLAQGDTLLEPNETFRVNLTSPSGAVLGKARGIGTILDDDGATNPDVGAFTIVSDGGNVAASGRNKLQWVNPVGGSPIEMRIRYNKGNGCAAPDPAFPDVDAMGLISLVPAGAPGEPRSHDHTGLDLTTSYCYTFWVIHSGPVASAGVSGIGRPFNATGKLKWKYATGTGTTGVAPPTIALEGILAVDNSGDVHAMLRSGAGGPWPGGPPAWNPLDLGSPSQSRNPIVPSPAGSRAFISTQDGRVHSVDNVTGALHWSTQLSPLPVAGVGAPAGIFTAFGGEHDAILVGTAAADDNVFHALDPATGAVAASSSIAGIGPIGGMAVVDYSRNLQNRVYFASRKGSAPETLWCLELGPPGPVTFTLRWKVDVGETSGSPVLRGGRIYVGTDAGEVKSVNADTGALIDIRTATLGDGPVRGFVFPDRGSNDVYASTTGTVWRLTDPGTGTALTVQWGVPVPGPSPPVLRPGATHLYVGGNDGSLYQLTLPGGAVTPLALDFDPNAFVVGAPSFDGVSDLVHVGSVRGVFYAVEVPLP